MNSINQKTGRILLTVIAVLLMLPGCSSPPAPTGPTLRVRMKDFKIEPALPSLEEGRFTLSVWNDGPTTHEFVVVRSARPADELPIGADGIRVDEDAVIPVDELEEIGAKTRGDLSVSLSPGRYVLFCNLEGHYLAGMHASIEVIAA
ncbi:MAG: hypothetical protein ACRDHC_05565 [Actinomycetota bacterium]